MSWWNRSPGPKRDFSLPPSRARIDAELRDEFAFHVEERRAELIAGGMSPAEAEAEVARRFGDIEHYRRTTRRIDEDTLRQSARAEFLGALWRETRHSVRVLRRQRAFSLVAFATLALGIGATTAMFAVLDAVLLRPLPYPEADRLVAVAHPATVPGSGERIWGISPGGYIHFARDSRTLEAFAIYRTFSTTVTSGGDAELARVADATHTIFDVLGARAEHGRLLGADDDLPGKPRLVVLSHEYHQRRFGGDPGVIGSQLVTSYGSYEIIGVTTPGVTLPTPGPFADGSDLAGFGVDLWLPQRINPAGPFWNTHPNVGVGRLKPGVTADAAQAEFATLLARFPDQMPNAYTTKFLSTYNFRVRVAPLREAVLGPKVPRALWMLFGSVLLVLVIAAANVGNLFLVRMEGRRREVAVRAALGADRVHLAAHHLSESLLLCGAAGLAAVAVAWGTLRGLLAVAPTDVPRLSTVALTPQAALVALGIAVGLGIVLGLVPLLRRGLDLGSLRDGGRGMTGSLRQRATRGALVVGQVALTVMLLAATGLMWRSFSALREVEPGFSTAQRLTFDVSLPFTAYDTREKALVVYRDLLDRLRALPGVRAASAGPIPLRDFGTGCTSVFIERGSADASGQVPCVPTPSRSRGGSRHWTCASRAACPSGATSTPARSLPWSRARWPTGCGPGRIPSARASAATAVTPTCGTAWSAWCRSCARSPSTSHPPKPCSIPPPDSSPTSAATPSTTSRSSCRWSAGTRSRSSRPCARSYARSTPASRWWGRGRSRRSPHAPPHAPRSRSRCSVLPACSAWCSVPSGSTASCPTSCSSDAVSSGCASPSVPPRAACSASCSANRSCSGSWVCCSGSAARSSPTARSRRCCSTCVPGIPSCSSGSRCCCWRR